MEDIIHADNTHTKKVCMDFQTQNMSEYHGLCVLSDTLLLADVSKKLLKYVA